MPESIVDSKGRVVIPEDMRKKLKIGEGTHVKITLEKGSDSVVMIRKSMDPQRFITLTKGSIKKNSPVKASDPLRLKEIWKST